MPTRVPREARETQETQEATAGTKRRASPDRETGPPRAKRRLGSDAFPLLQLPKECLHAIFAFLDHRDIVALLCAGRESRAAVERSWPELLQRRWPEAAAQTYSDPECEWDIRRYFLTRLQYETLPTAAFRRALTLIRPRTRQQVEAAAALAVPARLASPEQLQPESDADRCGSHATAEGGAGLPPHAFKVLQRVNRLIRARVVCHDEPAASTPTFIMTSYLQSLQLRQWTPDVAAQPPEYAAFLRRQRLLPAVYVHRVDRKSFTEPFCASAIVFSAPPTKPATLVLQVQWHYIAMGARMPASPHSGWRDVYLGARRDWLASNGQPADVPPTENVGHLGMYPGFGPSARGGPQGLRGYYSLKALVNNRTVFTCHAGRFHHLRLGVPHFDAFDPTIHDLGLIVNNGWRRFFLGALQHLFHDVLGLLMRPGRRPSRADALAFGDDLLEAVGHLDPWDWVDVFLYERLLHLLEADPYGDLDQEPWYGAALSGALLFRGG